MENEQKKYQNQKEASPKKTQRETSNESYVGINLLGIRTIEINAESHYLGEKQTRNKEENRQDSCKPNKSLLKSFVIAYAQL